MLQLQAPAQDEWLEPVTGLRVLMRPPSSTVLLEARRCYLNWVADGLFSRPDGVDDDTATMTPSDYSLRFLLSVTYIVGGAREWQGLAGEDAQPLTHPTPEQVLQLLHQNPAVFDALDARYSRRMLELVAEKNVSAPSPNGISEREEDAIATTATGDGAAAAETPAPTTRTKSKPQQAEGSGTSSMPAAAS